MVSICPLFSLPRICLPRFPLDLRTFCTLSPTISISSLPRCHQTGGSGEDPCSMHPNCRCHKAWLSDRSALLGDSAKREENFLDTILLLLASNFHFPLPRQLVGMPSKCQLRSRSVIVGTANAMPPNFAAPVPSSFTKAWHASQRTGYPILLHDRRASCRFQRQSLKVKKCRSSSLVLAWYHRPPPARAASESTMRRLWKI